jgi:Tfp pilus assembly protein PilO
MKISPRDTLIATALGLLIVVVALGAATIIPQYKQLQQIWADIDKANKEVDANKNLLAARQAAKERSAQTDAASLRLLNMVPENPEQAAFIIELQDAAIDAGVDFQSLAPGDPVAGQFTTLPMNIQVSGTWSDTIDFMRRLNNLSRSVRIVDFNASGVNVNDKDTGQVIGVDVSTAIKFEVYAVPAASVVVSSTPATASAPAQ